MASTINLLSSTIRVEVPFIKVTIGEYTFGIYKTKEKINSATRQLEQVGIQYPNFIQKLSIVKINGKVNEYTLNITYPIRPNDDPNFFEKVFSSVSTSRKIVFSYGDMAVPNYYYKDEQAIITKISTSFDLKGARIMYTVSATSTGVLGYSMKKTYAACHRKPSDVIYDVLADKTNGLEQLFYGIKPYLGSREKFKQLGIVASNDKEVSLDAKTNISPLDYINYLVESMIPNSNISDNQTKTSGYYCITLHDEAENDLVKGQTISGPYFTIKLVSKAIQHSDAYELTIGYPSANIITEFSYDSNENYSIMYNYQNTLSVNDYVYRLNPVTGDWDKEWAPAVSINKATLEEEAEDKTWFTKITEYPVSASITLKGLLRPALLMEYIRLYVIFHGKEHIATGLYIITKQTDTIDGSGYRTTLNLTRVDSIED